MPNVSQGLQASYLTRALEIIPSKIKRCWLCCKDLWSYVLLGFVSYWLRILFCYLLQPSWLVVIRFDASLETYMTVCRSLRRIQRRRRSPLLARPRRRRRHSGRCPHPRKISPPARRSDSTSTEITSAVKRVCTLTKGKTRTPRRFTRKWQAVPRPLPTWGTNKVTSSKSVFAYEMLIFSSPLHSVKS